jgi:RNA polymerase sigma-70 factor (ECF subfamily)
VDRTSGAAQASWTDPTTAFATFYDGAVREVYRYLFRSTLGDRTLAEDLTQETFAAVVAAARAGHPHALELPWVIGIARHKVVDHHRRLERERRVLETAWRGDTPGDSFDELIGSSSDMLALLRQLQPTQRVALMLRYCDDLTVDQIARSMGSSVHAAESLLGRARRSLARLHVESVR